MRCGMHGISLPCAVVNLSGIVTELTPNKTKLVTIHNTTGKEDAQ